MTQRQQQDNNQEPVLRKLLRRLAAMGKPSVTASQSDGKTIEADATMALRRVQSQLSRNWQAAEQNPAEQNWQTAQCKIKPTGATESTKGVDKKGQSQTPLAVISGRVDNPADIRGLDDIFPGTVSGIFMEDEGKPAAKPGATSPRQEIRAVCDKLLSPPDDVETIDEQLILTIAQGVHEQIEHLLPDELTVCETVRKPLRAVSAGGLAVPVTQPPLISVGKELDIHVVREALQLFMNDLTSRTIRQPDKASENPVPAETVAAQPLTPAIRSQEMVPRQSMANPQIDEDLADVLDTYEHLANNNRILNRSIKNLADAYFARAALEKDSDIAF